MGHNFLNTVPILTKPVTIESPWREFSIGAGFVKIRTVLRKLLAMQCNGKFPDAGFWIFLKRHLICLKKLSAL